MKTYTALVINHLDFDYQQYCILRGKHMKCLRCGIHYKKTWF